MTTSNNTPSLARAGDTVRFTRDLGSDYPSATWTAKLSLSDGQERYEITSTDNGDGQVHLFYQPSANTSSWKPGHYRYVMAVTNGIDRYTLENGEFEIKGNLFDGAVDDRSMVKKILDQLNDRIMGRTQSSEQSYSIAGRSISKMTLAELMEAQKFYAAKYQAEVQRQCRREGKPAGNIIKVSMR